MSDCEKYEALMERMIAGEPVRERATLLHHLDECRACRDLFEFHDWLAKSAPGLDEPDAEDLAAMRRQVLGKILDLEPSLAPRQPARVSWWPVRFASPAFLAAAAAVLLVAGFLIGRLALPAGSASPPEYVQIPGNGPIAAGGFESSPYLFSNVSVRPANGGQVTLGFDVVRHVELNRPAGDAFVREAVVHALLGSSPLRDRLEAVTLAREMVDPRVRGALIDTMEGDPSVAVRLNALLVLGQNVGDPEVAGAMLRVLKNEPNVQMRLLVVDYLGTSSVQRDLIRQALSETEPEGAQAVLVHASERLGI